MTQNILSLKEFIYNFNNLTVGLNMTERYELLFNKIKETEILKNRLEELNCYHKPFLLFSKK